jgi:hypothetical protein
LRSGRILFVSVHLHAPPQYVDPSHAACRPSEAILAALRGDLCKILQKDFREYLF